ncbi:alpha-ribazole phosphatase [Pararhodobacter aggregans]|uniref:Alpha-ribazole phosphatase n=1 Tax=Pararhodobacter aggregans TaxID=404875 RepID=A0A2T7UM03_9RHOB|nr:alpha-ribazole phosphatase [Pararhodobacter aggregans]PTX02226.1 alpha-ribazole phosphatase [Pararhodobacter aggregans]PVE45679.1 alpha-ribazole phosphatase [Pararhodobacter aggregans]
MALILLRHTRPAVAEGTCYGRTDLDLAPEFAADSLRIAAELPDFRRILSSPLSRCHRLAQAVGAARGLPVTVDPRLTEMDFGLWETRPWAEIPRAEIDAWRDDFLQGRPHGGESVQDLYSRVQQALAEAAEGPVPALVVTHAGVIRAALAAQGMPEAWRAETAFGTWRRIDWP